MWLCLQPREWLPDADIIGRPPFQGTPVQICLQHVQIPPPRMCELVPSISPAVERVVLKALAKHPQRRFAHVQEFAYALKQASSR